MVSGHGPVVKGCMAIGELGKPPQSQESGGHRRPPLTWLFLGRDSDLQSTRPRAETKPAEELRSWEKKQRAPLRYGGCGGGGGDGRQPRVLEHILSTGCVPPYPGDFEQAALVCARFRGR